MGSRREEEEEDEAEAEEANYPCGRTRLWDGGAPGPPVPSPITLPCHPSVSTGILSATRRGKGSRHMRQQQQQPAAKESRQPQKENWERGGNRHAADGRSGLVGTAKEFHHTQEGGRNSAAATEK